ncbi:MAG: hypothetical protein LBR08_05020 [Bacteroidales bacterium]|nr:hypothetical protein [Bacteroidales bacterium]
MLSTGGRKSQKDLRTSSPKGRRHQITLWTLFSGGRKPQKDLWTLSPVGHLLQRRDASRLYRTFHPVSR